MGLYPKDEERLYFESTKSNLMNSANTLSWGIVDGLVGRGRNITLLNMPQIPSYPDQSTIPCIKARKFYVEGLNKAENVPFNNLLYYKYYSQYRNIKKALKKWLKQDKRNRSVLVYAVYSPFLKACVELKQEYRDLKIIDIVPDVPKYLGFGSSFRYRLNRRINQKLIDMTEQHIDGYVFLTKYMADVMSVKGKHWTVVEGIYSGRDNDAIISDTSKEMIILYTGDLSQVYGITNLLNAFIRLKGENLRLIICGKGDMENYIKECAEIDKRIDYRGLVMRDEVVKLQQTAFLLVNPRNNDNEYTKYSFPSKTMEYFASGTPTLLCQLDGIPTEYFEYCYSYPELDGETLYFALCDIINTDKSKRTELGLKAQDFVKRQKNAYAQCTKILDLIDVIENK